MAKPAHTRITVSGHLGASSTNIVERWSFSLNSADTVDFRDKTDAQLLAIATAIDAAMVTHMRDNFPANCYFDSVKVASIDEDGQYRVRADGSYVRAEYTGTYAGLAAASGMPLQVALCVSLVTARSGPTGKGRFFLPWPAISLDTTTRQIPTAQLDPIVSDTAAFLGAVNDQPGINLAVVSSKGYTSDVTAIRIGRRPDTMRSRNEDLAEGYLTATVPQ